MSLCSLDLWIFGSLDLWISGYGIYPMTQLYLGKYEIYYRKIYIGISELLPTRIGFRSRYNVFDFKSKPRIDGSVRTINTHGYQVSLLYLLIFLIFLIFSSLGQRQASTMQGQPTEIQPIVTQNVIIHGSRIRYGIHGTGPPVVLLHGTPSSSLIWRQVLPFLIQAGFEVYVFDLLGYGLSERPWDPSVDTSITGQVPILKGLLSHWGLGTFHLVAHDIGGGIAQRFGVSLPGRLRSLTLIDVVSFDSYPSKRTQEQMRNGLEQLIKTKHDEHYSHFKDWLLSTVHDKQRFP